MSGGYRDDREALRQKVEETERALEQSREEADRLKKKLAEIESDSEEPAPPSAPPSTRGPVKRVWLAGFGTLALFLLGPALGIWVCVSVAPKKPKGSVESTGGPLGKWTMPIDVCQSGEHQGFFGVDLLSHSNRELGVRVIVDAAKGKLVNVNIPGGKKEALPLDREKCSKLEIDIKKTNSQVNDIHLIEGSLDFDCAQGETDRVFGRVSFENCQ